jgi:hypothetical protein
MWTLGCDRRRLVRAGIGTAALTAAALAMSAPTYAAGVHAPVANVRPGANTTLDNPIWAGYGVAGTPGSFSDVGATWTVPTVAGCSGASTSYSSFWAGLDGFGSNTVEQIGTDSDCINGSPQYFAWYEMYPKKTVLIENLSPGDTVKVAVEVSHVRKGDFTLTLQVDGGPKTEITAHNPSARLVSAEVIAEAPSSSHGPRSALPLADFTNVAFSNITVNGGSLPASPAEFVIQDAAGSTEATPNSLTADSFSVSWVSST